MILTVTPNPAVDKTVYLGKTLEVGGKNRADRWDCVPGGKGINVSRAVKTLGGETMALVIVGGRPGRHVVDMIQQQDGNLCIPAWVGGTTRTITTVLEEPRHRQTAVFEPGPAVTEEEADKVVALAENALQHAGVLTLNGTVPDRVLETLYARLIEKARAADVPVVLDTYGPECEAALPLRPHMFKPNLAEAEALLGRTLDSTRACWDAVDALHARGVPLVVLSLGKDGALVSREGEQFHAVPPETEEVNPVGSGDALVAGFALGIERDLSLEDMARLGIAASAANASCWNIGHFDPATVKDFLPRVRIEPRAD